MNDLEFISSVGEEITSSLDLEQVIHRLYRKISERMDATGFIIYLLDSDSDCLRVKHVYGKHKGVVHETIPMNSEQSFCVYTIKNKAEVFMNDVKKEYSAYLSDYYWKDVPDDDIIHSFINIPLVMHGKAFGVVSVQSFKRNAYEATDLELLRSLANYMSIAFSNADTYAHLNEARNEIARKNEDILGSIRYAQRIQRSLMPTDKFLERLMIRMRK